MSILIYIILSSFILVTGWLLGFKNGYKDGVDSHDKAAREIIGDEKATEILEKVINTIDERLNKYD